MKSFLLFLILIRYWDTVIIEGIRYKESELQVLMKEYRQEG